MVVITTGLVVLAATMYSAFNSIGFSRQRDTATNLANQAMEQIKAMNFANLVMLQSDLTGDSNVTCTGTPVVCSFHGRIIPTVSSGSLLSTSPLDPHIAHSAPAVGTSSGPSTYTIDSYVTFNPNGNTQARVATVVVTWTNPVKGGVLPSVQIESTIFAAGPLASGSGHAWSAQAVDSPGSISVTGTLLGLNLASVQFGPGSSSATVGVNGTATAQGTVAQNLLQLLGLTLLHTNQSSVTATSAAGQGLSAPAPDVESDNSILGQTEQSILNLVDVGNLGFTGGLGLTGTTKAVASSSAAGATNLSGQTMPNSGLPYAQGYASQTGPVSLGLNLALLSVLGITLGSSSTSLLSVTPLGNGTPDLSTVCQQASAGACAAAMPSSTNAAVGSSTNINQPSYAGQAIVAQAQKSFSDISIVPALGPLLEIKGFTAAASAAAGPGISNSAKATSTALSVSVLGHPVAQVGNLLPILSTGVQSLSSALGVLGISASLTEGSSSTNGNSALVTSPVTLTVSVTLSTLLNISININLGTVSVSASYS